MITGEYDRWYNTPLTPWWFLPAPKMGLPYNTFLGAGFFIIMNCKKIPTLFFLLSFHSCSIFIAVGFLNARRKAGGQRNREKTYPLKYFFICPFSGFKNRIILC
jgi:hypothetical protein